MRKLTKLLSLLLSLCLVLSFFPAASADGVIEQTDPAPAEEQGTIAPVTEGTIDPAALTREPAADEIQASSGTCGENLTWTLDDDGVLTISGTGRTEDFYPAPWYNDRSLIKSAVVEEGVTYLGANTFYECDKLSTINIARSVTAINSSAFQECTGITEIRYGGTTEAWKQAIPSYRNYGFPIICSNGVIEAADRSQCGDDLNWSVQNGVLTISGTGDMWDDLYDSCPWSGESYSSLVLEEGVTSVGAAAFMNNSQLSSVTLPASLKRIGPSAFGYCRNLTTIDLPAGLSTIESSAFSGCPFTEIHIPAAVTALGEGSLAFSSQSADIYFSGTLAQWRQVGGPDAINHYTAAVHCSDGEIPAADQNQCGDTMTWSISYETMNITGTGDMWNSPAWLKDPNYDYVGTVYISEGVTSLGDRAFSSTMGNRYLSNIFLPGTLRQIGSQAFAYCRALNSITLPASLEVLEPTAFGFSRLNSITFQGSAPSFGEGAFRGIYATVYYPANDPSWTEEVRQDYGGTITWEAYGADTPAVVASGTCGDALTWTLDANGTLTISGTGPMVDNNSSTSPFQNYVSQIRAVKVEEGATTLCNYAFAGCEVLQEVSLPDTLESIGSFAFSRCFKLGAIRLPKGVQSVAVYAFHACKSLIKILVSEENPYFCSVDGILYDKNVSALLDCPMGKTGSLAIPETVTEIGPSAFYLSYIEKITMPAGIVSVGRNAFAGCNKLKEVHFTGAAPTIDLDAFMQVTTIVFYPGDDASWTDGVRQNYGGTLTWLPTANAVLDSGQCGENAFWALSENGVLTISGTGAMWDYEGDVDNLPPWILNYSQKILVVHVEEGITRVGIRAFHGGYRTPQAKYLSLPESLVSIGDYAFCRFGAWPSVTSLPSGLREIGKGAFYGSSISGDLCIPGSVDSIGKLAFSETGLTVVTVEDGVKTIGDEAFAYGVCTSISLPASVSRIGEKAFANGNKDLKDIYFAGSTAQWQQIAAPDAVEHYITTVHCQDGDILPAPSERCGDDLTWSLDANGVLTVTGTGNMWDFYYQTQPWYDRKEEIKSVVLGDGVTSVGDYAFHDYPSGFPITELRLPAGLREIGEKAFDGCTALSAVNLPESLSTIEGYAFYCCSALTAVSLPSGLKSLGTWAFYGCTALTAVSLPSDLKSLEACAFCGCTALTAVSFPERLETIADAAFSNCTSLTEITFQGSAPTIDEGAFWAVTATAYYPEDDASWTEEVRQNYGGTLTWVAKYMGPAIVDSGACGDDLTWRLDENGLVTVSGTGPMWDYASRQNRAVPSPWSGNNQVQALLLKPGVTSVGSWAFAFCQLREVEIPETVTAIGASAFSDCSAMETLSITGSVETIGSSAFSGCSSLSSLDLPEGVESIGSFAFEGCCGLTELSLPATLTEIGDSAFSSCFGIREISFAGPAPTIGENAFTDVQDATVYYPAEDPSWTEALQESLGEGLTWTVKNPGDVNGDGVIDILDLVRLLKYFAGTADTISRANADLTGDGTVSAADLMYLRLVLIGLKPEAA